MMIGFSRVNLIYLIALAMKRIVSLWLEALFIVNDNDLQGLVTEPKWLWSFPLAFT